MIHPDDYFDVGDKGDIIHQIGLRFFSPRKCKIFVGTGYFCRWSLQDNLTSDCWNSFYPDFHNHWKWKITLNERKRSYWRETNFLLIHDYGRKGTQTLRFFFFADVQSLWLVACNESLLGLGTVQEQLRRWSAVGFICVTWETPWKPPDVLNLLWSEFWASPYIHHIFQIPKIEVLTYINCM